MNFYNYIFSIAAAQGFILAIALFIKKVNVRSNRVLAVWMLCMVFDLAMKTLYLVNPNTQWLPAYILSVFFPFLYGSFFYLYVRSITLKQNIKWFDLVHFLGFLFMVAVNLPMIVNPWENNTEIAAYFDPLLYLYSISYVLAGLIIIKRYRQELEQQQSNTEGISLLWIDVMAYFQVLVWFIAVSQWLFHIQGYNVSTIYAVVSIWMVVMGYLALIQQNINPVKAIESPPLIMDDRFPEVDAKLTQLMQQQQLYLEPTLNIGQLAKKSGYPEYLVSLVINNLHQQTFREYINNLRIEAAKSRLSDPQDKRSILDIAYDCGFTSKSTFNSAFKKLNKITPSEFKSKQAPASDDLDGIR